jgi:acyl-coenzyme A synthetase/AMP-(fatty) acid ligase
MRPGYRQQSKIGSPSMSHPTHVVDMVFFWAKTEPHRLAIIQPEMVTTFQGLADAIEAICDRIDRLGLDTSEPVAVSIANPSYSLAAIYALFRCGFSVAPVTPALYPHLRSAGIRNLIYDNQGQVLSGGRNIRFDMSWMPSDIPPEKRKPYRQRPAGNGDLICFTSGTTGLPKPAFRSMEGLSERRRSPLIEAESKLLIIPSLAGVFGFNSACSMLYAGKAACFAPLGEAVLALVDHFNIDCMVASNQQALTLSELRTKLPHYKLSSLKTLRLSGALLSKEAARRIKTNLCRNLNIWYSSSEGGLVAVAPYDTIADVPGAVGFVLPDVEVQIVDREGTVLPAGAEGIIRLRSSEFVANSRAGNDGSSAPTADLWFYPGDIGRLTENGLLCLAGRFSDVINRGGVKVSATRIEEILEALPDIKEAAACGIDGPSGLEEIWIAIVSPSPIDVADIKRHLAEHRDIATDIDQIIAVPNLPRNDAGKVQKHILKETLLRLKKGA